jgi:hypothetical protein
MTKNAKLTPAMQRVMEIVARHGYVDLIRDGRTLRRTVDAMIERGLLREFGWWRRGVGYRYYPANTPEQVWDEAHTAQDAREQCDCLRNPLGHSRVEHPEPLTAKEMTDRMSAEGRQVVRDAAHAEALEEYREVTRAARKADSAAYQRELQREMGLKVKGDPSDAETLPLVHAFNRDIYAASSAAACGAQGARCGDPAVITCPECRDIVGRRAQTIEQAEAGIAQLDEAIDPDPIRPMNDTVTDDDDINEPWEPASYEPTQSSYSGAVLDAIRDSLYTPAAGDADRYNELGEPAGYVHRSAG